MKSISLLAFVIAIALVSCGQEMPASKVPSVVANAVKVKFPDVNEIEWQKKRDYYEAGFKIAKKEHSAFINSSGQLIQHKWEIQVSEIPAPVQAAVQSIHPGFKIDDAAVIESNGQLSYELELEAKAKKDKKVVVLPNGEIITNK